MTGFIRRFLPGGEAQDSFEALFGSPEFRERVEGLSGLDLEDAAVDVAAGEDVPPTGRVADLLVGHYSWTER